MRKHNLKRSAANTGFKHAEGENSDGRRVLGKGFPEPIQVMPGQYVIVSNDKQDQTERVC